MYSRTPLEPGLKEMKVMWGGRAVLGYGFTKGTEKHLVMKRIGVVSDEVSEITLAAGSAAYKSEASDTFARMLEERKNEKTLQRPQEK